MMDWNHGWGYTHGFGWILLVLFWIVVILGIVALVRWLGTSGGLSLSAPPKEKTALDILDERFARGEIDQQEYEQKREVLKRND